MGKYRVECVACGLMKEARDFEGWDDMNRMSSVCHDCKIRQPEPKHATMTQQKPNADIEKPDHYNWLPGIECGDVVRHFPFWLGNAIKYIWRAGRKHSGKEGLICDLKKAIRSLEKEVEYLENPRSQC